MTVPLIVCKPLKVRIGLGQYIYPKEYLIPYLVVDYYQCRVISHVLIEVVGCVVIDIKHVPQPVDIFPL